MKKNKAMRAASALLVVTLLTTSMISGTFAKYTTQDSASDNARVAKWGVALQVVGNLYGESYKDAIVANDDSSLTVKANDAATADDDVVAPGTKNDEGLKFSLTGTPEVSTKTTVTIKAQNVFLNAGSYGLMVQVPASTVTAVNFSTLGDLYTLSSGTYTKATAYAANTTYYTLEDAVTVSDSYYPVVYKLAGDTNDTTGTDASDTINVIANKLAGQFGTVSKSTDANNITTYTVTSDEVAPNTDLDTKFAVDDEVLTWAWAFGTAANVGDNASENDKADTILGLLMGRTAAGADALDGTVVMLDGSDYKAPTEHTDYCLDTQFSIDITVTQVD